MTTTKETTMTKTLRYGKGYSGKMGNRCWIARITGTDSHYGLARDFVEADRVEREHFNRARTMVDLSWDLTAGLYELSEGGERWFSVVYTTETGETKSFRPDDARVKAIAALLDAGQDFEAARKATKPANAPVAVDAQAVQS